MTPQFRLPPGTEPTTVLIVSNSPVGPSVISGIRSDADVRLITDSSTLAERVPGDTTVSIGPATDFATLDRVGADEVEVAIVALRSDRKTLLTTQKLRAQFDVEHVIALTTDPDIHGAIDDVVSVAICQSELLASELHGAIETTLSARDLA